jgi:hypothetical protein
MIAPVQARRADRPGLSTAFAAGRARVGLIALLFALAAPGSRRSTGWPA